MLRPSLLVLTLAAPAAVLAADPLDVLSRPAAGLDQGALKQLQVDRLVAIRQLGRSRDPLLARALSAAYARLSADPASGFGEAEKVAALQAMAGSRDASAGPCATRALGDPSRPVRGAALQVVSGMRHPQAVPMLVGLLAQAASPKDEDRALQGEDLALARRASDLLDVLANTSNHFEALSSQPEQQIAVTRWRKWWETHRDRSRAEWQEEGFKAEGIQVSVPKAGEALKTEEIPALLGALAAARPEWIQENAQELLAGIPLPGAKLSEGACGALVKGLDHADQSVRQRAAKALHALLSRGAFPDLPAPAEDLPDRLKRWLGSRG